MKPLRWWPPKASGERAANGFLTSWDFRNFHNSVWNASADHDKQIAKYEILSSFQGLEVKAEESHLRPRLQLKSIKRILWSLLGLSVGDTFWLLCLKKSTLIISISFPIFSKRIVLSSYFLCAHFVEDVSNEVQHKFDLKRERGFYDNVPKTTISRKL